MLRQLSCAGTQVSLKYAQRILAKLRALQRAELR